MTNFDRNNLTPNWLPPLSNDKKLLEARISFFKNNDNQTLRHITLEYEDFINAFEKSIKENNSIKVSGLELFRQKDVIIGCLQFIDQLIMTHGLHNLQLFEGGYEYYKKLDPKIKFVTLDTIQPGKPLVIEYPFPLNLGEHPDYKKIIEKCNNLGVDVYLDCAWLPASFDLELDLDQPCIKGMGMSLSKCYGLHWSRIGVRWLKHAVDDATHFQNKRRMVSYPNLMIGQYYLDRFPMDYLVKKYRGKYEHICEELNFKKANTVLGAYSLDDNIKYGFKDLLLKDYA